MTRVSYRMLEVADLFLYSYTGVWRESKIYIPDSDTDKQVSWFYFDSDREILKEFFD